MGEEVVEGCDWFVSRGLWGVKWKQDWWGEGNGSRIHHTHLHPLTLTHTHSRLSLHPYHSIFFLVLFCFVFVFLKHKPCVGHCSPPSARWVKRVGWGIVDACFSDCSQDGVVFRLTLSLELEPIHGRDRRLALLAHHHGKLPAPLRTTMKRREGGMEWAMGMRTAQDSKPRTTTAQEQCSSALLGAYDERTAMAVMDASSMWSV